MTVENLIKVLKSVQDKSQEVYISGDPEGNNIRTVDAVSIGASFNSGKDNLLIIWPDDTLI
jgi:hypothetical protein